MENKSDNKPKYNFLYIKKPQSQIARWTGRNPKLQEFGNLQYFAGILCPVSTADVQVVERTRAEYDTIEFVILKLFASGLQNPDDLASITGLELDMVKNVLSILQNTYHHIDGKNVTAEGMESLENRKNIQCYKTGKQVQFEAVTGTVLLPVLFQSISGIEAYYYALNRDSIRRVLPKHYIERDVRTDIIENLRLHRERGTIERNFEKILDVTVEECTYTEAFLVKYDYLPHPFIIFPVQGSKTVTWMPVAVSKSTEKVLKKHDFAFDFYSYDLVVRPDSEFEALVNLEKEYGFKVSVKDLPKTFSIGDKEYEIAKKDSEDAVIKVHPETGFTPVYCVEKPKDNKKEDD